MIYSQEIINLLKTYVELFPIENRTGRLVRYILKDRNVLTGSAKPVGKNSLKDYGSYIATFLRLPNPECYTSHFSKRTAATLIANAGGTTLQIQRAGNWRSPRVAEGYVARSLVSKRTTSDLIGLLEDNASTDIDEQRPGVENTSLTVRSREQPEEIQQEPVAKVQRAEQQYNFNFNFQGANGISLANFQLCNSSINPSVSTNTTTSRESNTVVSALTTDIV